MVAPRSFRARPSSIQARLQRLYHQLADRLFAALPQPAPSLEQVRRARIVSHRGEHDNRRLIENTLAAFDAALAAGVWGIECDIRWTQDLQPVVCHDPDLRRLFGSRSALNSITGRELRGRFPLIPSLEEVVARYGKRLHLMLEFKAEVYPDPVRQSHHLATLLADLVPARDYHLLSLTPALFQYLDFAPPRALLPIGETNVGECSRLAIDRGYAGMAGHYLLVTQARVKKHHRLEQQVGTGFVASRNCLYRELRRGVDWVFSDCAARLQRICDRSIDTKD